ncbi:hypothetical protein ACFLU6_15840, partial [Acidobacteriota bacterium]
MSENWTKPEDPLVFRNLLLLPIYHGFMEFALAVRDELEAFQPDALAVELPRYMKSHVQKAVDRLPYLSIVISDSKDGNQLYFPVEPQDAIIEAVRFGREKEIPVHFIDSDVSDYGEHRDPLPDPFAAGSLGIRALARVYEAVVKKASKEPEPKDI